MIWEKKLGFPNCIICQHQKAISNVSEVSCRERLIFLISNFPFTLGQGKRKFIYLFGKSLLFRLFKIRFGGNPVNFLRKCLFFGNWATFLFQSFSSSPSSHLLTYYYPNCIINVCVNSTFLPQYVFVFIFICNLVIVVEN